MKNLSIAIVVLCMLSSCQELTEGIYRLDEIHPDVWSEVSAVDQKVVSAIQKGDHKSLHTMLSPELSENAGDINGLLQRLQELTPTKDYETVYAYHVVNKGSVEPVTILSSDTGRYAFEIRFKSLTKESYISILQPKRDGDQIRLFLLYGKYDDQWKLNVLQYGRHTIAGMDAIEHFQTAQAEETRGHLIDAINRMVLAGATSTPASNYFVYQQQDAMQSYNDGLIQRALDRYPMPMTVESIPSDPAIFKVMPQRVENSICSMVKYKTTLSLEDSLALQAENDLLHDQIEQLFKGITVDKPYVFYRAYSSFPEEGVSMPYFGFVQKTETDQINLTE